MSMMINVWLWSGGAVSIIIFAMLFIGWWFDDTDDYDEPDQR